MLDVAQRFMPGRFIPVFLYFVKGLEFQERTLQYYETKFGIEIKREVHWDVDAYLRRPGEDRRALRAADIEKHLRAKYNCPWVMLGYRKDESLQRRGHLGSLAKDSYIDHRNHKLFPVADWLASDIVVYIKTRRLYLPPEYANGFRNIDQFKGAAVTYIKNSYHKDYARIVTKFPQVEAEAFRISMKD